MAQSNKTTVTLTEKDLGYKKFKKAIEQASKGEFADAGLFEENMESEEITRKGASNEFGTENVPERSWQRTTFDENEKRWLARITAELSKGPDMDIEKAIKDIGEEAMVKLSQKIIDLDSPPNAERTIEKKGFDNPLIETGDMLKAVAVRYLTANAATKGQK